MKLHPRVPLTLQALHGEPGAAEDTGAQPLLESDRELHARRRAHEAVPVTHVALSGCDFQGQDLTRQLGGKRQQSRTTDCGVLRHEESATRNCAAERAHESALLAAGGH